MTFFMRLFQPLKISAVLGVNVPGREHSRWEKTKLPILLKARPSPCTGSLLLHPLAQQSQGQPNSKGENKDLCSIGRATDHVWPFLTNHTWTVAVWRERMQIQGDFRRMDGTWHLIGRERMYWDARKAWNDLLACPHSKP